MVVDATFLRDANLQAMASFVLGEAYDCLGDYHRAIDMLRRNVEALDHTGSQERFGEPALGPGLQAVGSLRWLIQALADVGAFAEGIALAEDALRLAEADGHPYTLNVGPRRGPSDSSATSPYIMILRRPSRPKTTTSRPSPWPTSLACARSRPTVLGLGRLYGQSGRVEEARVELHAAIELYRVMAMTFWPPQAEAALGQVEAP